jgi:hypothetical protein
VTNGRGRPSRGISGCCSNPYVGAT